MRGLALCLVAGALVIAGCGSNNNSSSSAPKQQNVASSGATGSPAAVSAKGQATPGSLCTPEGKGKPKKQCVTGLTKLDKGKAANPKAACKGLSKKKTKGVRGKSPFAACVKAAAKLMASKQPIAGNGAADSTGTDTTGDTSTDSTDSSSGDTSGDGTADPICRDANGNTVPFDSEDVEECDPGVDTSASGSSNESSSADGTSTDDTSTDGP